MFVKKIMEEVEKTAQDIAKAKAGQPTRKNNCFGNVDLGNVVDYSPLTPINLNVKITPDVTGYLTNAAATTALKGSVAMEIDAAKEDSMSIIGYDGGIFGHLDFPH